jgi:hypothetical protein
VAENHYSLTKRSFCVLGGEIFENLEILRRFRAFKSYYDFYNAQARRISSEEQHGTPTGPSQAAD